MKNDLTVPDKRGRAYSSFGWLLHRVRSIVLAITIIGVFAAAASAQNSRSGASSRPKALIPLPFAFPVGGVTGSSGTFVTVSLPRNVSVALPRAWRILGPDELQLIGTAAGAMADLSGLEVEDGEDRVLIAANSMPTSTYAAVRVTSSTPPSASTADLRELAGLVGYSSRNNRQLAELEREMRPQFEAMMSAGGMRITEFYGIRVDRISGHPALVTEYRRSGPRGDVYVQLNHIMTPHHDVKVNLSYRELERAIWLTVLGRVRHSLRIE